VLQQKAVSIGGTAAVTNFHSFSFGGSSSEGRQADLTWPLVIDTRSEGRVQIPLVLAHQLHHLPQQLQFSRLPAQGLPL